MPAGTRTFSMLMRSANMLEDGVASIGRIRLRSVAIYGHAASRTLGFQDYRQAFGPDEAAGAFYDDDAPAPDAWQTPRLRVPEHESPLEYCRKVAETLDRAAACLQDDRWVQDLLVADRNGEDVDLDDENVHYYCGWGKVGLQMMTDRAGELNPLLDYLSASVPGLPASFWERGDIGEMLHHGDASFTSLNDLRSMTPERVRIAIRHCAEQLRRQES